MYHTIVLYYVLFNLFFKTFSPPDTASKLLKNENISLERLCNMFSSLFETVHNSALPIFINEGIDGVHITAPKYILELLIFLLFHKACFETPQSILRVSHILENGFLYLNFRRVIHEDNYSSKENFKGYIFIFIFILIFF